MRLLKRYDFDELKNNYPSLSLEEQQSFIGGEHAGVRDDSLVQILAYLDNNPTHNVVWYQNKLDSVSNNKTAQRGGIVSDSISSLGRLGGLNVNLIHGGTEMAINPNTSRTSNGRKIIMTIPGAGISNRVVVVTGVVAGVNNTTRIDYFDPTTHQKGSINGSNFVEMFEVY